MNTPKRKRSYSPAPTEKTELSGSSFVEFEKYRSFDESISVPEIQQPSKQQLYQPSSKPCASHDGQMHPLIGVAGNVLVWYDFAIFGYFSDILGELFFPPQTGNAAMAESFAVFGGAFLMRPIGGMLMGYIGDLHGRKKALELSIFLMAFPTFAIGCLPTYTQVGWLAIPLLSVARLLQGLSVGGQLMSSLVFTVERHPREHWGHYGSYVFASATFGVLLGSLVGYGMRVFMSDHQLRSWGWRIPFLSGILVSLVGLYLKIWVQEDLPAETNPKMTKPENPILAAFSAKNRRALLSCCMAPVIWSGGFYLTFVWMAVFMEDLIQPVIPAAFAINTVSLFFGLCLPFPVAGILSDIYGRERIMTIGGCCVGLFGPLAIYVIGGGNPLHAFLVQTCLGICLSLWGAPMCAWMVESFPPETRLTACAIGYNVAQAMVGGTTPGLATVLVDTIGIHSPGFIFVGMALTSLAGLKLAPKHCECEVEKADNQIGDGGSISGEDTPMLSEGTDDDFSGVSVDEIDDAL